MRFIYSLFKILKAKWIFKKPGKCDLLIYDNRSLHSGSVKALFGNKKKVCLETRYESINCYILFKALKDLKFNKLTELYKKYYLQEVNPKIVYTNIDNNPAFYNLKNIYEKPLYICDQHGVAKVINQSWPNDFQRHCIEINFKSKKKLGTDLLFTYGEIDKFYMSKFLKGKILSLGSSPNNFYNVKRLKKKKKIANVNFICSGIYKATLPHEIKIFNIIKMYCAKNNFKLTLMARGMRYNVEDNFFREKFGDGDWSLFDSPSRRERYEFVNNSELIIFAHTTLGLEALAKGVKCIILLSNLAMRNMSWQHKKEGYFWTSSKNFKKIEHTIDRVIKTDYKKWDKIANKVCNTYMNYDRCNQKKIKHIERELGKKF